MIDGCKWGVQNVFYCRGCGTYQHIARVCPKCGRISDNTPEEIRMLKAQRVKTVRPAKYPPKQKPRAPMRDVLDEYISRFGDSDSLPTITDILETLSEEGHNMGRTTINAYLNRSGWHYDTKKQRWVR